MKAFPFSILVCGTLFLVGCIESSHVEQRVVQFSAINPNSKWAPAVALDNADFIIRGLVTNGLVADVQKQFPSLTQQQLSGLYLTCEVGNFQGNKSVFLLTGIRYRGSLPEAKAIADYCKSRVAKAVADRSPRPKSN